MLSNIEPQGVKKCTVAGWIKSILGGAGIDTSKFTTQSTRSASTLIVKVNRLFIGVILKRGFWFWDSTRQKCYHNLAATNSELFQETIDSRITLSTKKDGVSVMQIYSSATTVWENSTY